MQGFAPEPGDDVLAAYRAYAKQIAERWRADPDVDPLSRILIAALDLLAGQIDAADEILDDLPAEPVKLDHGAGYCLVAPFVVLAAVLPWPDALKDTATWVRGSETQQALRDWLEAHRDRLAWDDEAGTYRLTGLSPCVRLIPPVVVQAPARTPHHGVSGNRGISLSPDRCLTG